ncbi:MAG: hypothetical protein ACPF9Z_09465, partial [Paracoccaceae bacterium]
ADRRHSIGKTRPSASRSKRIDHEQEVMLTIEKSMVSMPKTANQRHVLVMSLTKIFTRECKIC